MYLPCSIIFKIYLNTQKQTLLILATCNISTASFYISILLGIASLRTSKFSFFCVFSNSVHFTLPWHSCCSSENSNLSVVFNVPLINKLAPQLSDLYVNCLSWMVCKWKFCWGFWGFWLRIISSSQCLIWRLLKGFIPSIGSLVCPCQCEITFSFVLCPVSRWYTAIFAFQKIVRYIKEIHVRSSPKRTRTIFFIRKQHYGPCDSFETCCVKTEIVFNILEGLSPAQMIRLFFNVQLILLKV
jgi:hypothetical protein